MSRSGQRRVDRRRSPPASRTGRPRSPRPGAGRRAPRRSAAASLSTSMLKVVSSTSTNTGVAPSSATHSAVAAKVKVGTNTASPGPTPCTISAMTSASVPLAHDTTCSAPQNSPSAASSCGHLGAHDVAAVVEHRGDPPVDVGPEAGLLCGEVDELHACSGQPWSRRSTCRRRRARCSAPSRSTYRRPLRGQTQVVTEPLAVVAHPADAAGGRRPPPARAPGRRRSPLHRRR